ncbi:MAG TPA: circularly permuted type 2 ATP-grasp protein [Solirubrobacteraceae bacterium]
MASEPGPQPPFDEDRDADGNPRAGYAQTLAALEHVDLDELSLNVARHLEDAGVRFGNGPFVIDPIPRLITAAEWHRMELGLIQRTRALNCFLRDVYGPRRIVAAGLLDAEVVDGAEGFEPDLAGRLPDTAAPAAIVGFDLIRAPSGEFLVLEDNLRTPSGFAYLIAARAAMVDTLPSGLPIPRPVDPALYELLAGTLRAATPRGTTGPPSMAVLTDGPDNVAYYEHACAAERLGAPLLTPEDLELRGDELFTPLPDGSARRLDVVYRRTDEDRVRDENGNLTSVAELLLPAWQSGNLGLVNAFGNGVADDKLVHAHVETFVRFYLEQEPLIRSVPTHSLETETAGLAAAVDLERLVVKPRHGHGGAGVVIGSHADDDELDAARSELARHPERYIAQPIVPLSRHPTVIDGRLQPRHVDLRPFAFCAAEIALAPGGLSRVAFDPGEMVVNSSKNGGGKDTWVID